MKTFRSMDFCSR